MFDVLIHADWSCKAQKRWAARAERAGNGWRVKAPEPVGSCSDFLDEAFASGKASRVLLGFDFPIGLPFSYGIQTGLAGFREGLEAFGREDWPEIYLIAEQPDEISIRRPFYPRASKKGSSRASLVDALGVSEFRDLLRTCERASSQGREASVVFWTLGGAQVGRAAISGWQDIVSPALTRGAGLWPFDGQLAEVAATHAVVVAETYPALAYAMVGAGFRGGESKTRQADRASKANAILAHARRHGLGTTHELEAALLDGFGSSRSGEDRFDAVLGLLKMIEIVDQRQQEFSAAPTGQWEGWILGR